MSNSTKPMRVRAMTVAGGIALIGATGAGMSGSANAASTSTASTTLAKIKYCESGGNYQAVNSSSGASGAYQFLNSTWRGLSAAKGYSSAASAPASVQDAAALELYNQSGTSPWAASSSCWSKLTSVPSSSTTSTTTKTTTAKSSSTTSSVAASSKTSATTKSSPSGIAASTVAKASARPAASNPTRPSQHSVKPGGHSRSHHAAAPQETDPMPHGKAHAPSFPKAQPTGKHHRKMPMNIPFKGANALPQAA